MPSVHLIAGGSSRSPATVLALPVSPAGSAAAGDSDLPEVAGLAGPATVPAALTAECSALLEQTGHRGRAGQVQSLPRPLGRPRRVLLVGIGDAGEASWRSAGAAVARAAVRETSVTVALPPGAGPAAVRGLVEGALLASYRYRLGADRPDRAPRLRRVQIAVDDPERDDYLAALAGARAVAEATWLARDLTNTPSSRKYPGWFVRQLEKAAAPLAGVRVRVWDEAELRRDGFGGILAVGAGSARPPRLLQLSYRPTTARGRSGATRTAGTHVVLVGKGITFDTGGISIKPADGMKLMRKDMAGAAAVVAATLGAATLRLPVQVTALAPLAENMLSGSAQRPGDVVRHWGGRTSEVRNTDAEGRLVLADALAYAAARLRPDLLVDLATLTGANAVALGKRTGALYSDDADLAGRLETAASEAGEQVWRMPLIDDYTDALGSDVADLNNSPDIGAGSVMAALFLREFTGAARDRWAHIDMSAPAWTDQNDGELSRGATGWGVRTLLRLLASIT